MLATNVFVCMHEELWESIIHYPIHTRTVMKSGGAAIIVYTIAAPKGKNESFDTALGFDDETLYKNRRC